MSLVLGKEEKTIRDESSVSYHSGHTRFGNPMWGRLLLTNRRFLFSEQKVVETGPFFAKKRELQTLGIRMNLPVDKVIGAQVEGRTRKKGTLHDPPSLMSKEAYNILIVSLDDELGVQNPVFEVSDPQGWATAIQTATSGERVG